MRITLRVDGEVFEILPKKKQPVYVVTRRKYENFSGICIGDRIVFEQGGELLHVFLRPTNLSDGASIGFSIQHFHFDPSLYEYHPLEEK